jgi:hypothetical protein
VLIAWFSSCKNEVLVMGKFNLHIQIGKTKIVHMPGGIIKDKEKLDC